MKAKNYNQILKSRGYVCAERSDYQGQNVFIKRHLFNNIVCTIEKDSHGKGQTIMFAIHDTLRQPKDMEEFKKANLDRELLYREALKIHEAFEQLKQLKAPKHLYCF